MVVEYHIDVERFNAEFSPDMRRAIKNLVAETTKEIDKGPWGNRYAVYWNLIGRAFNRHHQLPPEFLVIDDLFPPNIAALDWLMSVDKKLAIADIGCGLGNLLPYLKKLGFQKVWGYDTWLQIEKWRAEQFLGAYGMLDSLISLPVLKRKRIDIVMVISLHFEWVRDAIAPILDKAQWLLADASYLPKDPIEGYEEVGRYPNLLVVYKKVNNAKDSSR